MSGYDHWRQLRHAAMAVRVGALVLLAFLLAPASFVSGPVGDAQAQQQPAGKVYRIGFLSQGQPPKAFFEALQQGLRERGYVEGRNLVWELRSTDGSLDTWGRRGGSTRPRVAPLDCRARRSTARRRAPVRAEGHWHLPSRLRVGFATYFVRGFHEDHWLCEYWDGDTWRLLDAELDDESVSLSNHLIQEGAKRDEQSSGIVPLDGVTGSLDFDPAAPA